MSKGNKLGKESFNNLLIFIISDECTKFVKKELTKWCKEEKIELHIDKKHLNKQNGESSRYPAGNSGRYEVQGSKE